MAPHHKILSSACFPSRYFLLNNLTIFSALFLVFIRPVPKNLYSSTPTYLHTLERSYATIMLDVLPALQAQYYMFTIKFIVCSSYWIPKKSFPEITQIPQPPFPLLALNPRGKTAVTNISSSGLNPNLATTETAAVSQARVKLQQRDFQMCVSLLWLKTTNKICPQLLA